ncbi:hypothetical protein SDC9_84107 [bioreactor metagenome]|uniref:DUF4357 domain-containing protein n=1 Tax=bioreactor metagenome TaxID=1076179 RepID=A0A644Z9C4_9ZZZZ
MAFGRKVTIFLSDGAPSGIRHVEIANWSGQAIACPRSRLNKLRDWVEAQRPGVYFLLEKQTAETGDRAYIGESENVAKRLTQQEKNQDFWNEAIIFTSKDENLTKGHIKYLESRLTAISIDADRYKIENANTPTESQLPRADKDAMEEFIHNLRIVLGTLGHRVLEPVKITTQQPQDGPSKPGLSQFIFSFSIRGLHATGQQTDDGFVLFKGSDVSGKTTGSMPGKTLSIREKWIADGTLQPFGDNFRLAKDCIVSSSSYAAVIVAGTSRSGPQSWIDEKGRSLKAVEESLLSET